MLHEGGLHWVKMVGCAETLDRRDDAALVHDGEAEARIDATAIKDHRASAALAVVAALLRACELEVFAQSV
jgi:hypothetical protein